ncbi:MAG: DUF5011 domain-containing protein, partial [Bacilli bacterium]|nr:DUF5011 domain-containing protein [Bacilli bacterium]
SANTPNDLKITELFKKGTEPTEVSSRFNTLDNVKNAKASLSGNTVTLTWDKLTPATQNTSWVNQLFSDSGYANSFIASLNNYNRSKVGTFGYNIYAKNSNGTLSFIKFVTDNKASFTVRSSDPSTYVIKASYSILTACQSSGTEVSVDLGNVKSEITASLLGSSAVTLKIGETYTENGIAVSEDGNNITSKADFNITITSSSGVSTTVTSLTDISAQIDTTKADTYTITYEVSYEDFTETLERTITIQA